MFSAMILACVLNADGTADIENCRGFTSPFVWPDLQMCTLALQAGIPAVEEQGWAVQDYECYDWKAKKGTKL